MELTFPACVQKDSREDQTSGARDTVTFDDGGGDKWREREVVVERQTHKDKEVREGRGARGGGGSSSSKPPRAQ